MWNDFDCPASTEARIERAYIYPERNFNQLIWETIVSDAYNDEGMLSRLFFKSLLI